MKAVEKESSDSRLGLGISDNPTNDTAAWMQNRLDGSIHPALNTDNPLVIYDEDKHNFTLHKDEYKPDLYELSPTGP